MAGNPEPELPPELLASLGDSIKGYGHATFAAGRVLPLYLYRANRIRRGALLFLNNPRKPHKH